MVKILILILLIAVIFGIVRLSTRRRKETAKLKSKSELPVIDIETTENDSRWGICKSCGERRIIMKEGMCAYCWSSSQTQGLK